MSVSGDGSTSMPDPCVSAVLSSLQPSASLCATSILWADQPAYAGLTSDLSAAFTSAAAPSSNLQPSLSLRATSVLLASQATPAALTRRMSNYLSEDDVDRFRAAQGKDDLTVDMANVLIPGEWLSDNIVSMASDILAKQFSYISGLAPPLVFIYWRPCSCSYGSKQLCSNSRY